MGQRSADEFKCGIWLCDGMQLQQEYDNNNDSGRNKRCHAACAVMQQVATYGALAGWLAACRKGYCTNKCGNNKAVAMAISRLISRFEGQRLYNVYV